jgi:hypothetical protein
VKKLSLALHRLSKVIIAIPNRVLNQLYEMSSTAGSRLSVTSPLRFTWINLTSSIHSILKPQSNCRSVSCHFDDANIAALRLGAAMDETLLRLHRQTDPQDSKYRSFHCPCAHPVEQRLSDRNGNCITPVCMKSSQDCSPADSYTLAGWIIRYGRVICETSATG